MKHDTKSKTITDILRLHANVKFACTYIHVFVSEIIYFEFTCPLTETVLPCQQLVGVLFNMCVRMMRKLMINVIFFCSFKFAIKETNWITALLPKPES